MSCFDDPETQENKRISRRIDKELRRSRRDLDKESKLLLLGNFLPIKMAIFNE
jgi:hypothetical protein